METETEYTARCPLSGIEVTLRVTAELGNGCGCAVDIGNEEFSCSLERQCPFSGKPGCLLDSPLC